MPTDQPTTSEDDPERLSAWARLDVPKACDFLIDWIVESTLEQIERAQSATRAARRRKRPAIVYVRSDVVPSLPLPLLFESHEDAMAFVYGGEAA